MRRQPLSRAVSVRAITPHHTQPVGRRLRERAGAHGLAVMPDCGVRPGPQRNARRRAPPGLVHFGAISLIGGFVSRPLRPLSKRTNPRPNRRKIIVRANSCADHPRPTTPGPVLARSTPLSSCVATILLAGKNGAAPLDSASNVSHVPAVGAATSVAMLLLGITNTAGEDRHTRRGAPPGLVHFGPISLSAGSWVYATAVVSQVWIGSIYGAERQ